MSHFDGEDPFAEMRSPITPLVGPAEAAAQRSRVVTRMQRLQESSRERRGAARVNRRRVTAVFVTLAIAASIAGALAFYRDGAAPVRVNGPLVEANSSKVAVVRAARTVVADREANLALQVADQVQTKRGGGATLKLRSGATIAMFSASDLSLVKDERGLEEVLLRDGYVRVRVPKLAKGQLLVVRTPDASVTVHGTHFIVTFGQGCNRRPCTHVSVAEGRVEVEHAGVAAMLGGGDFWSSEDDQTTPEPAAPVDPATASAGAQSTAKLPPSRAAHPTVDRSTLAEENALLERAMTASRTGDAEHAVSMLNEHLKKYPRSPLGRNAELERLRALERAGNLGAARAAARRYLASYPDGMGADEARRIAVGTRSPVSTRPLGP